MRYHEYLMYVYIHCIHCIHYHTGEDTALTEWEYLPPVGMRPSHGFVGLKNGGATCYMNSVFQQLFMIEEIRSGILGLEGVCDNLEETEHEKSPTQQPPNVSPKVTCEGLIISAVLAFSVGTGSILKKIVKPSFL